MLLMNRFVPATAADFWNADLDRIFRAAARPTVGEAGRALPAFPALNVWEDAGKMMVEAELAGLKIEDIDVAVVGNGLTIKGRRHHDYAEKVTVHRQERGVGDFVRGVTLPFDIDASGVQAALKDGVLTITLPQAAAERARKITVKPA